MEFRIIIQVKYLFKKLTEYLSHKTDSTLYLVDYNISLLVSSVPPHDPRF